MNDHGTLEIFGLNHYHNSTGIRDEKVLAKREAKAKSQDDHILKFMRDHYQVDFTPSQVYLSFGRQWPITSVRRALTFWTKAGWLVQLDKTRPGLFGTENHCWQFNLDMYGKAVPTSKEVREKLRITALNSQQ